MACHRTLKRTRLDIEETAEWDDLDAPAIGSVGGATVEQARTAKVAHALVGVKRGATGQHATADVYCP